MNIEKFKNIKFLIYFFYLTGVITFIIGLITKKSFFYSFSIISIISIVVLNFIFDIFVLKYQILKIKLIPIFITILSGILLLISINNKNIAISNTILYVEAIALIVAFNLSIYIKK